jgi:hypothetical protein
LRQNRWEKFRRLFRFDNRLVRAGIGIELRRRQQRRRLRFDNRRFFFNDVDISQCKLLLRKADINHRPALGFGFALQYRRLSDSEVDPNQ